ncbi:hypothetical protein BQ8420_16200 [Nocardiopsis sp. JB363]|nr:hypothetical protein BQ8420_16200 [Nocardiopsis sp. JB363]
MLVGLAHSTNVQNRCLGGVRFLRCHLPLLPEIYYNSDLYKL